MDKRLNPPKLSETLRYAMFGAVFGATFPLVGTLARMLLLRLPINISNMIYAQGRRPAVMGGRYRTPRAWFVCCIRRS
jgi:hypothetical protein